MRFDEITYLWRQRKSMRGSLLDSAVRVRDAYNGDFSVPLPEMDVNEAASVANLLRSGLDGSAQRCSSTMPDQHWPPDRPNIASSVASSRDKRRAGLGWWEASDLDLVMARRFRHLLGYTQSAVMIRPDFDRGVPMWHVRDPLECFPSAPVRFEDMTPTDCIFAFNRPLSWLEKNYPSQALLLNKGPRPRGDTSFTILEYVDEHELVTGVVGFMPDARNPSASFGSESVELDRIPNRAGVCTAVIPGLVTLDRLQSRYLGMISMFMKKAKLDAAEYLAIMEGVFPRTWAVSHAGEQVKIVTVADGREGTIGHITGGTIISPPFNPGYKTDQAMDRLEREMRLEGSVPAQMGGENPTNVRTARASDSVLGSAIDFDIAENQRLMARSCAHELDRAVEVAKGWFGNRSVSFHVDWRGAKGPITYKANQLFAGQNAVKCRYAMAGTDLNGQIVRIGQKLGIGMISKTTARELDPEIVDPELEGDRVIAETLETAGVQGMAQQLSQGAMSLDTAARVAELILTEKLTWWQAVRKANQEMQTAQATSGPPGTPEGPVAPGAPEAQPGIAPPGVGGQAGEAGAAITPQEPSLADLTQRLRGIGAIRSAQGAAARAG